MKRQKNNTTRMLKDKEDSHSKRAVKNKYRYIQETYWMQQRNHGREEKLKIEYVQENIPLDK